MTDTTTCPTTLDSGLRVGQTCGRKAKANGYCGFHAARANQTSAEGQLEEVEEGRGTAETRSEPAPLLDETAASGSSPASAEPNTVEEVGDATAAHDAPEVAQRPASSVAPKPAPPVTPAHQVLVSSRGASRRLRALTTLGHTPRSLATATGLSDDSVWWLMTAPPEQIHTRTHILVATAYKRLRVTPLDGQTADRARALAHRNDWPGPYDWDDIDTDPLSPHHTSHKAWDSHELTAALNAAKLEQGDPEAFSTDAVVEARAEAGRLRVELEQAGASYEQLRSNAAAALGQVDGLQERIQRGTGEIRALQDQLDAANADRARLNSESTRAASRIAELEDALAAGAPSDQPIAPVSYIDATSAAFQAGPALAAEVSITIERTDSGGIRVAFPEALLAEARA